METNKLKTGFKKVATWIVKNKKKTTVIVLAITGSLGTAIKPEILNTVLSLLDIFY